MEPGLYMVATPIGNLDDLSPRARAVLAEADLIACEDTRHSARLLAACGIGRKHLVSVHEHNETDASSSLIRETMTSGHALAYVSDAGTPGVSDPGARLCKEAHRQGLRVFSVGGPSALASCLSVCGFKEPMVLFCGFMPRRSAEKRALFEKALRVAPCVLVFYESPHRVLKTIEEIQAILAPTVPVCLSRELSKVYESNRVTTVGEARACLLGEQVKGEFTIAVELQKSESSLLEPIAYATSGDLSLDDAAHKALEMCETGIPLRSASQQLARSVQHLRSRDVYQAALQLAELRKHGGSRDDE